MDLPFYLSQKMDPTHGRKSRQVNYEPEVMQEKDTVQRLLDRRAKAYIGAVGQNLDRFIEAIEHSRICYLVFSFFS